MCVCGEKTREESEKKDIYIYIRFGEKEKTLPEAFVTSYTCIRSHPCIILDLNCPGRIAKTRDLSAKTIDSPTEYLALFFFFFFCFLRLAINRKNTSPLGEKKPRVVLKNSYK